MAGFAVLGLSAEGMWVVARERLHLPAALAACVFFVAESLMLSAAMHARHHYEATTVRDEDGKVIRPGHPGKHGTAVWVIAIGAGVIVSLNSKSIVEFPLRLALPIAAAYMWWASLTTKGTSRPVGTWRWTARRLLARIGAIDPEERALRDVDRERRVTAMTIAALRVHSGARLGRWHAARLRQHALQADDAMVNEVQRRLYRVWSIQTLTAPTAVESTAAAPTSTGIPTTTGMPTTAALATTDEKAPSARSTADPTTTTMDPPAEPTPDRVPADAHSGKRSRPATTTNRRSRQPTKSPTARRQTSVYRPEQLELARRLISEGTLPPAPSTAAIRSAMPISEHPARALRRDLRELETLSQNGHSGKRS